MAKIETYACDICGAQKGQTNHWWLGNAGTKDFIVQKWDSAFVNDVGVWHLCGSQCLLEWVSQTVDKLSGIKEG